MFKAMLGALGFAALVLSALPFLNLLIEYPIIALSSLAFVALMAGGYELVRKMTKP